MGFILIFPFLKQNFTFSMLNSHCIPTFFAGHPKRSQSSTSQGHTLNSFANSFRFIDIYSFKHKSQKGLIAPQILFKPFKIVLPITFSLTSFSPRQANPKAGTRDPSHYRVSESSESFQRAKQSAFSQAISLFINRGFVLLS